MSDTVSDAAVTICTTPVDGTVTVQVPVGNTLDADVALASMRAFALI
jgi:hypothetical protein